MNWKKLLGGVMPVVSTVIGTTNPLAGFALKAASKALLGKEDGTETEVEIAFKKATPADIAAMRKEDQAFQKELSDNDIELETIHAEDRDSARKMKIETGGSTQEILAGIFIIGYFVIVYNLFSGSIKVDATNNQLTLIIVSLISIMGASVTQIMNFYFGSSKGSKDKTQVLKSLNK